VWAADHDGSASQSEWDEPRRVPGAPTVATACCMASEFGVSCVGELNGKFRQMDKSEHRAVTNWCAEHHVLLRSIEPGRPPQNGHLDSFNGQFRDECLNANWFTSLPDARHRIELGITTRPGRTVGVCDPGGVRLSIPWP
jgi:Integrase core domain